MSDASQSQNKKKSRYLRSNEKEIIRKALDSSVNIDLDDLKVLDADDGHMGGIKFEADDSQGRSFGSELARFRYIDADGVPVSIVLSSDMSGNLFEVDFWKVDFSPLVAYPTGEQLVRGDP